MAVPTAYELAFSSPALRKCTSVSFTPGKNSERKLKSNHGSEVQAIRVDSKLLDSLFAKGTCCGFSSLSTPAAVQGVE